MKKQRNKSDLKRVLALLLAVYSASVQTVYADHSGQSTRSIESVHIKLVASSQPTLAESQSPSIAESLTPSAGPTTTPTSTPSLSSLAPTPVASDNPTSLPTLGLSLSPSVKKTLSPSAGPTKIASSTPSARPSPTPTQRPSHLPSRSASPSITPTHVPTEFPSQSPTVMPSSYPSTTMEPSNFPSMSGQPTGIPSQVPTRLPSAIPTSYPTLVPTQVPSDIPTLTPSISANPSDSPSYLPSQTNVVSFSSIVTIEVESISETMDNTEREIFQNTAKSFVTKTMVSEKVGIIITSVEVAKQVISKGATNGLVQAENRKSVRLLEETGLLVELVITGDVSYGTLPGNFTFLDAIKPGFQQNFDQFLKELDDSFAVDRVIGGPNSVNEGTSGTNQNLVIYLSSGGFGLVALAALLFLSHKKKRSSRIRELQDQSQFVHAQSSVRSDGLESSCEMQNVPIWNWVDPSETNVKKVAENPYGDIQSMDDSVYSSPTQQAYSFKSSDISASDLETPTGSASVASMGINLSPEALYEARKQHQTFSFIPQEARSTGISHSYPDQNGRLVYKSYVCSAPAGPLGIIIDTTAEGPMVHAIKPTSQLLGSIAPGDIVVGLDNIETRQMTAPALTRLMARKSQQSIRKITLLRPMSS